MPDTLEAPPNLSPAAAANLQAAAIAGKSPMEMLQTERASNPNPAQPIAPNGDTPYQMPEDALRAAQNKDRGVAPAEPASAPSAKKPDPRIPNVPQTPPAPVEKPAGDGWRPKGEEAGKQWDALRTERDTLKAEVERARAEAAKIDTSEVEQLRQQLETYQKELRDVAIERDPQFKQRFEPRRNAAIEAAKNAAGDAGEKLAKLLGQPQSDLRDQQIEKLTEDLSTGAKRRIDAALGILEGLDLERETEIAASRQTYDQRVKQQEQQTRLQTQQREQQLTKAFKSEVDAWKHPENGSPFLREIEGNAEHNAAVAERIQQAQNLFSGKATPEALSNAVLWAVTGPAILEAAQAAMQERDAYKARLDGIRGTTPGAGREGMPSGGEDAPQAGTPGYSGHFQSGLAAAQQADRGR